MAKITAIEVQKKDKKRYNLFLDGEFFSGVSMETVLTHHLNVGDELEQKELGNIIFLSEKEKALNKALDYLSKTIKTRRQIKDYLSKKGYSEEIIYNVINKLIEYNIIDDVEYSKRYIESTRKRQGKKLIEFKLMEKGVRKEDIIKAYDQVEETEEDLAYNLAVKHIKNKERTRENYSKTYKYLIGKGFAFEEIDRAIMKLKEEE